MVWCLINLSGEPGAAQTRFSESALWEMCPEKSSLTPIWLQLCPLHTVALNAQNVVP